MNMNIEPGLKNYPTGFCPPLQPEQHERNDFLSPHLGKIAAGLLISTALVGAKPVTLDIDQSPELPAHALVAPPLSQEHHMKSRQHHKSHPEPLAVIATVHHSTAAVRTEGAPKQLSSPPSSQHLIGAARQGTWITNPQGYYLGRAFGHDKIKIVSASSANSPIPSAIIQERGARHITVCGYLAPGAVSRPENTSSQHRFGQQNPCSRKLGKLASRYSFGKDFNCPPHQCVDGAPTTQMSLTAKCNDKVYYNYIPRTQNSAYVASTKAKGRFYDYAGKVKPGSKIYYRYTTLDNTAVVVRVEGKRNWLYEKESCVRKNLRGGTPKR